MQRLFTDTHVHLYRREDIRPALDAAERNFRSAGAALDDCGLLMLADPAHVDAFEWIRQDLSPDTEVVESASDWTVVEQPDDHTLRLSKSGRMMLVVLSGEQAISSENLEVLVFPPLALKPKSVPAASIVSQSASASGTAILPWGVGKWLGGRGREVAKMIDCGSENPVILADNGGRPSLWPRSGLLNAAKSAGLPVVTGTDPLPLPGESDRIGSFGVISRTESTEGWGHLDFLEHLASSSQSPYGRPMPMFKALALQTALRRRGSTLGGSAPEDDKAA